MRTVIVTGGCGFIGSNFLRMYVEQYPEIQFINIDKLTYAANPTSLDLIMLEKNYRFERVNISNQEEVFQIFERYSPDTIIHFAAESHVDRSIVGPADFMNTNIIGTFNLLEACRKYWKETEMEGKLFHHVSTDEVFGSLGSNGFFVEETRYDPSNPYSASKASSDHLVRSYFKTYGIPITITNCSNNYGPYQFPEKLIPLMIISAVEGKQLPIYGDGRNIRDWLYVEDHCEAIWKVINEGKCGETYNVGGNNEKANIEIVQLICLQLAEKVGVDISAYEKLITFVKDRPGHDRRYAIDSSKIKNELGWKPKETFETGLGKTINWYLDNVNWVASVKTGLYLEWLDVNYYNGLRKLDKEMA